MARPLKEGFDYFPFLTSFFRNKKIRAFLRKPEPDYAGILAYIYILCAVYEQKGYYIKADDDLIGDIAFDLRLSDDEVLDKIQFMLEKNLFEQSIAAEESVLTSKRIQLQFQEMSKKRGKTKTIPVIKKLWLLAKDCTESFIKVIEKIGFCGKNEGFCGENTPKVVENTQSKVKESKINKSKANESSDAAVAAFHKYEQLIGLITPSVQDGIDFFVSQGVEVQLIIRLIEYACEQGKRTWAYIKASIKGNMDAGIKTLDAYNRAQAQRAETAKRVKESEKKKGKGINNYNDTNFKAGEYTAEKFIAEMLGEV